MSDMKHSASAPHIERLTDADIDWQIRDLENKYGSFNQLVAKCHSNLAGGMEWWAMDELCDLYDLRDGDDDATMRFEKW